MYIMLQYKELKMEKEMNVCLCKLVDPGRTGLWCCWSPQFLTSSLPAGSPWCWTSFRFLPFRLSDSILVDRWDSWEGARKLSLKEGLETIFGCKSFVLKSGWQCILPSSVETACVCLVFVYWLVGCGLHSMYATALLPRWMQKASGPSLVLALF